MAIFDVGKNPYGSIGFHRETVYADSVSGEQIKARPGTNAQLVDAVIAAVRRMNSLDQTPTAIMNVGAEDNDLAATDKLIQATNKDVIANKNVMGEKRIIGWGLFTSNWMAFKDELTKHAEKTAELEQKKAAFRARAIEWAKDVSGTLKGGSDRRGAIVEEATFLYIVATPRKPDAGTKGIAAWPMWKKLLVFGGGTVGVVAAVKIYQSTRTPQQG